MELEKVLTQLRHELHHLDLAIQSLERLHQSIRRRGRPPSWLSGGKKMAKRKRGPGGKPHGPGAGKKPE